MTSTKNSAPAKPAPASTAPKPPKKLIPRTAPKTEAASPQARTVPANAPSSPAAEAAAKQVPAKRPAAKAKPQEPDISAHQAELAKALVAAQAVKIAQPLGKPDKPKAEDPPQPTRKAPKAKKPKLVRDSFTMPEDEYRQIAALKKRMAGVKKSELLRAGIALLASLNDAQLTATLAKVVRIKTGRPSKNGK